MNVETGKTRYPLRHQKIHDWLLATQEFLCYLSNPNKSIGNEAYDQFLVSLWLHTGRLIVIQRYGVSSMTRGEQFWDGNRGQGVYTWTERGDHLSPAVTFSSFWTPIFCSVFLKTLSAAWSAPNMMWTVHFRIFSSVTPRLLKACSTVSSMISHPKINWTLYVINITIS